MLASVTASMSSGADQAKRTAKATKLKGEILILERKVKDLKHNFGPPVYDAMISAEA